jgi:hypothetical protein
MRQPASLARKVVNAFLQTVIIVFNLDERYSLILVRAVGSGHGNSAVFVLVTADGEVLVHAEESKKSPFSSKSTPKAGTL